MILNISSKRKRKFTINSFGGNLKTYLMSFHQARGIESIYGEVNGSANQMETVYEIGGYLECVETLLQRARALVIVASEETASDATGRRPLVDSWL